MIPFWKKTDKGGKKTPPKPAIPHTAQQSMYAYEGYDITEISKVYGVSRPTISIKIKRITKFLKNFNFNATN